MGRRRYAALAVAALLGVSGCGGVELTPTADAGTGAAVVDPLADAVASTAAAGSARTTVVLSTGTAGGALEVTGEGVVDFTDGAARHEFRLPEELGGGSVEQLSVGGGVWVRSAETGDRYVELVGAGLVADLLGLLPATDPLGQVTSLGGAEAVRLVGRGDVRGVPTTRYEARVPLTALADSGPAALREQLTAAVVEVGADTVTVTVDVDEQGRLRRLAPEVGAADGSGARLWAGVELHDFGVEVDLQPPAPDQVDGEFLGGLLDEAGLLFGDEPDQPGEVPAVGEDVVLPTADEVREELRFLLGELTAE